MTRTVPKVAMRKAGSHQVTGTVKADGITESAAQIPPT